MKNLNVFSSPWDVRSRLADLGLEPDVLKNAVVGGQIVWLSGTDNHPPAVPAISAWGETVRLLRDQLIPRGWTRRNESNYPITVHPDGKIALAVASGDIHTGIEDRVPSTASMKGPATFSAIAANRLQIGFDQVLDDFQFPHHEDCFIGSTWLLLVYRRRAAFQYELSLPLSMTDGHIDSWKERIVLGTVEIGPASSPGGLREIDKIDDINIEITEKD